MKRKGTKLISWMLTLVLVLSMVPVLSSPVAATSGITEKLDKLRNVYPNGWYWNHYVDSYYNNGDQIFNRRDESYSTTVTKNPCYTHNGTCPVGCYDCNFFDGGLQCWGFASRVFYDVFGQRCSGLTKRWDTNNIQAGDYVRFGSDNDGHSAVVLSRDNNVITIVECNYGNTCAIRWDRAVNISQVSYFKRATNYNEINTPPHVHTGYVCSCGYYEPLAESPISGTQQSYIVSAGAARLYEGPYVQSKQGNVLSANTPLTCVAYVTNKAGQKWYKLGGNYSGKWILASSAEYHPKSDLAMFLSVRDNPMTEGKTNAVTGNVNSSYYKMQITAYLDGVKYYDQAAAKGSLLFQNSEITNRVNFDSLEPGMHTIKVKATDEGGGNVEKSVQFEVMAAVTKPKIARTETVGGDPRTNEPGGKRITLSCATGGAAIYYTLDGSEPTQQSTRYGTPFKVTESCILRVRAFLNDKQSAILSENIKIQKVQDPVITTEDVPEGTRVTITGESNAVIYYRVDGAYDIYKMPFILKQNAEVSAYARKSGCKDSEYVKTAVEVHVPETPTFLSPATDMKYAQNDSVTFKWNRIPNASQYFVTVWVNGVEQEPLTVTEPNATICLEEPGTYSVSVMARNAIGKSNRSETINAISVAPLTVRYLDWDDSVISEQTVDFGGDAAEPIEEPTRKGYFFLYWDGNPTNITENTIIKAVYRIRSYDVTFYDQNGDQLEYKQTVEYGGCADLPDTTELISKLPTGFKFLGWNVQATDADSDCDYNNVDSDMKITAVVGWFDQELPLIAEITEATRDDDNYSDSTTGNGNYCVKVHVQNWNQEDTTAMLRVSLKTAEDKMVKTEFRTIWLDKDGNGDYEFTLKYSGTATVAEVVTLGYNGDYKTGSALSQANTKAVTTLSSSIFGEWSVPSEEVPQAKPGRIIETITEYRYQSKSETTSTKSSLSGWTRDPNKTPVISSWGAWSGWLDYAVTATTSRQVQTQTAVSGYNMKTFCVTVYGTRGWAPTASYPVRLEYDTEWWSKAQLDSARVFYPGSWFDYASNVAGYVVDGTAYCKWDGSDCGGWAPMFIQSTTYKTQYRYRDAVYTYYYYKWSDWSDWQSEPVASSDSVNVETRTLYRYKDKEMTPVSGTEDTSGLLYTFSGTLPVDGDLKGKIATVMVYKGKNTDPNESQLQYVGQTTIGEGNTYSLSFKTKDEPTIASGDYIVSLGLQGATGLVNVGMIEAPKPKYTVSFYSESTLVSQQTVEEGENAELPEAPQRDGYRFITWSETGRNVHGDLNISAVYTPITYAVVFVDWINGTATPFALEYGSDIYSISEEMKPTADGYTFLYWDEIESGHETVEQNLVISAVYEPKKFTVNFYDGTGPDKQIIATRQVAFGKAAELPENPTYTDKLFLGWSTNVKWWDVRSNMDVYPILSYNENAANPISASGAYVYGMQDSVTLQANEGAQIYYTVDGSDPVPGEEGTNLYTGPIPLEQTSKLIKAIAVEENKNNSEIVDIFFDYTQGEDYEVIKEQTVIQQLSPIVKAGDTLTLNINIQNNPGLEGYLFFVECDPTVYYMDYLEDGYDCTFGAMTTGGTSFVVPDENGWRVMWFNTEAATGEGTLFTLNLKVAEGVEYGNYPIMISYSAENMICGTEDEEFNADFEGVIGGAVVVGDINGDNDVTLADVILIAKYKAGLYSISDLARLNAADVDRNGSITLADVVFLSRFIIGLESAIPT